MFVSECKIRFVVPSIYNCKFLFALSAFIFSICPTSLAQKAKAAEKIEIKGTVVAEYRNLVHICYHVCGLLLIVKLDEKAEPTRYVLVQVEYMDVHSLPRNGMPVQLVERAARWRFEAVVESKKSRPLQKFMNFVDENGKDVSDEKAIPVWSLLKGAENEVLPFGEPLSTYIVRVGKFKSVK